MKLFSTGQTSYHLQSPAVTSRQREKRRENRENEQSRNGTTTKDYFGVFKKKTRLQLQVEATHTNEERLRALLRTAMQGWISDTDDESRVDAKRNEVANLFSSIHEGSSSISVSSSGELRLTAGEGVTVTGELELVLKSAGIRLIRPATVAHASSAGVNARLWGLAYRDQLKTWVSECQPDTSEFHARMTVVQKIRAGLNYSRQTGQGFTLTINEISDLGSPPPMPAEGIKIAVAENQFTPAALNKLRDTGVEVSQVSSEKSEARSAPNPQAAVAAPARPSRQTTPHVQPYFGTPEARCRAHQRSSSTAAAVNPAAFSKASTKPLTLEEQLGKWISSVTDHSETDQPKPEAKAKTKAEIKAEIKARQLAAQTILTWNANFIAEGPGGGKKSRSRPAPALDLSSQGGLKFTTIPPLPSGVNELIIKGQNLREADLRTLPAKLASLDLEGNPLASIHDENLPASLDNLRVNLGVTTLPPRIVRKLNMANRKPAYNVYLPASETGRTKCDTYTESWLGMMPSYQAYIDRGGAEKESRKKAIERLEEWVHGDNDETTSTPLNFSELGLTELPSDWPYDSRIKIIDAKGNALKEIPLSTLPSTLKYLDLRGNPISNMPPELTSAQMQIRDSRKGRAEVTSSKNLIEEMQRMHGVGLHDPHIVDPRERDGLAILIGGSSSLQKETAQAYEARTFGPTYAFSSKKVKEIENDMRSF